MRRFSQIDVLRRGAAFLVSAVVAVAALQARADETQQRVVLADRGVARLPIVAGSVAAPVEELRGLLKHISGADFQIVQETEDAPAIFVGLAEDFPQFTFDAVDSLGAEGFVLKTDSTGVFLVGRRPLGVQHAVTTFLHRLGCRWFFPGPAWEVVPQRKTIAGVWNERSVPSFPIQRSIHPGYGLYPQNRTQWQQWDHHNRMGGPLEVVIHHTFNGLNSERDFETHPDWFALVDGRRQPTKPCYSHPDVIQRATEFALKRASEGVDMVPMSPPDGLGYCECPKCLEVLHGAKPYRAQGTLFGKRPDGVLVNVTSETLFALVNRVAAAVAEEYPQTLIGCYAYSAYSHPPSFDLHPNVYLQTTTAYRRTPLTLDQQLAAFGRKTKSLGVREYYSVYQWDWDGPDPGRVRPDRLAKDLRFFRERGVTAVNAEVSNNWGPRGLGYYVASQLLWDVDADVPAMIRDFYEKAFGPAARPMQRYYARWYGPVAVAIDDPGLEIPTDSEEPPRLTAETLAASFRDLDDAVREAAGQPENRKRVDQLRLYIHFLAIRQQLETDTAAKDQDAILAGIEAETVFGGRLNDTNLVHARPLIGKAFPRRFRRFEELLANLPAENRDAKQWRQLGTPPDAVELERLWSADKRRLGIK